MRFLLSRLTLRVRAILQSDWEECAPLRWCMQIAAGALPGVVILLTIMHVAAKTESVSPLGSRASLVPLLSARAIADTPAFHRLHASPVGTVMAEAQFRAPRLQSPPPAHRVLTVTKRTSPVRTTFHEPRQAWRHLSASDRQDIDHGLSRSRHWEHVVLHGSGSHGGSARLLQRYQSDVQGVPDGMAWHFVIGNGQGARDGKIEVTEGWRRALPAASGRDPGTRYTSISVCLTGGFHEHSPTEAQLEALDELLDYLGIKLGRLDLSVHEDARGNAASCLGDRFPGKDSFMLGHPSERSP